MHQQALQARKPQWRQLRRDLQPSQVEFTRIKGLLGLIVLIWGGESLLESSGVFGYGRGLNNYQYYGAICFIVK